VGLGDGVGVGSGVAVGDGDGVALGVGVGSAVATGVAAGVAATEGTDWAIDGLAFPDVGPESPRRTKAPSTRPTIIETQIAIVVMTSDEVRCGKEGASGKLTCAGACCRGLGGSNQNPSVERTRRKVVVPFSSADAARGARPRLVFQRS
jgi:hypothetical protein